MCKFVEAPTSKHNLNPLSVAPSAKRFRLLSRNTKRISFSLLLCIENIFLHADIRNGRNTKQ